MLTIAQQHQKRIAYRTLAMAPAVARIMGGMSYEEAYALIFGTPLRPRLASLISTYGVAAERDFFDGGVCWELGRYKWTPAALLRALDGAA